MAPDGENSSSDDGIAVADDTIMRNNNTKFFSTSKWPNKHYKSANVAPSPWIHPPGALQSAHVAYFVKFLGCTDVESPKGIEVVKAGIQKMRFNSHMKRSEGSKIPKVELTISIDGVAIQDPKTKRIMYQYPLYRISYCADDKAEKRFFCFIAKENSAPDDASAQHKCFVFVSDRLAENITLTIGQAFDLAYRRFLETSGRELEMRKQILILQKRARLLERENMELKSRINELESVHAFPSTPNQKESGKLVLSLDSSHETPLLLHSTSVNGAVNGISATQYGNTVSTNDVRASGINAYASAPTLPVRRSDAPALAPPLPPRPRNGEDVNGSSDLITLDPFAVKITPEEDPFGDFQKLFSSDTNNTKGLDDAIGRVDQRIAEMKEGFSRGLTFGKEDFSLESFDPLSKNGGTGHA